MANLSLTRVNQKLAQARLLLQQDESTLSPVHRQSLIEAASFHLVCAYQHYLRELAETYGLKNALGVATEIELAKAFEAAGKHPAEAEELRDLRSERSWLADLHRFYDSLWRPPIPAVAPQENNLINLVDVDAITAEPNLAVLSQWHSSFVALVRRHRDTSAEF